MEETHSTRHLAELRSGNVTADDVLAQPRVLLVLQVEEQRANFILVGFAQVAIVAEHSSFDGLCALEDKVICWPSTKSAVL